MNGTVIGIIGIVIALLLALIPFVYKKLRAPIKITPRKISLKSQPWDIKTTFHMQNRSTEALFDVWIKIILEDCNIETKDVHIDSGIKNGLLSEKLSNIFIDYEFVRMDGTDGKNNKCIFFILYSLTPQSSQPFSVEVKSKANIENNRNPQISLSVIRNSKTPVQLVRQNNQVGYPVSPPEKFMLKSLSLKMWKK